MSPRVRFAPSPTGYLHVGNVRTALFNWLTARQNSGTFLLRIEDTDADRSEVRFEEQLVRDLEWLGLDWNEGFQKGGDHGPYRQTERALVYQDHAERLLQSGAAYYCFCTAEQLEADRKVQLDRGESVGYVGRCREISSARAQSRVAAGEKATVRLKVRAGRTAFDDLVFGRVEVDCSSIGDFILLRSDGSAQYNFACTVDDRLMEISHVIRGEGHISNTHRQNLLYESFGWEQPQYAHLSTIIGPDGTKLSKRHGATSIAEFRTLGYLPEALLNYLSLLGWAPPEELGEILPVSRIVEHFSFDAVNVSPATFDFEKLNWVNRSHLKKLDRDRLAELGLPFLVDAGLLSPDPSETEIEWATRLLGLLSGYIDRLSDLPEASGVVFGFEPERDLEHADVEEILTQSGALEVINRFRAEMDASGAEKIDFETYKSCVLATRDKTGQKGKSLFRPIRIALTARASGPELDQLIDLLEDGSRLELPRKILDVRSRVAQVADFLAKKSSR